MHAERFLGSECTAETAQVCNSTGTGYDAVQCARGCDPSIGCRLCDAGQTVCTNGTVQSCDATGGVVSSETCPLGCFEDQPRCREIDPSNGLGAAMNMAAAAPDLVLQNATLSVPSGMLSTGFDMPTKLASVTVAAPVDGVPIQAFPARTLSIIGNLRIVSDNGTDSIPAVAFIANGDITLNGTIVLDSDGNRTPGSLDAGACVGQEGLVDSAGVGYFGGGGGGGASTRGGNGGGQAHPARQGGVGFANPDLQPLRGGGAGGAPSLFVPGYGGGALQITSRSIIRLTVNAMIQANGSVGYAGTSNGGPPGVESEPGGGGGGGGILLEAPQVLLASGATLVANGGAGTNGSLEAGTPGAGRTPSVGTVCHGISSDICTRGGNGGSITTPDSDAPSIDFQGQQQLYTGAGGGAIGYIRINTSDGGYGVGNDVFTSPMPTTGTIATR